MFQSIVMRGRAMKPLLIAAILWAATPVQAAMELVMIERDGCIWCARWNEEIAPIYPKTEEAAAAPLRRIALDAPLPDDVTLARPALFTPTFVLLVDGQEASRIEGYPGADFFWALLGQMIAESTPAQD